MQRKAKVKKKAIKKYKKKSRVIEIPRLNIRRFNLDSSLKSYATRMNLGRSTLLQTTAGLFVCAGVWRYIVAPKLLPHRSAPKNDISLSGISPSITNKSVGSSNTLYRLDSADELQRLGDGVSVALFVRGLEASGAEDAQRARSALEEVANMLKKEKPEIRCYVIDDASAQVPALTLMTRLGLEHSHNQPYLVVLDRFVLTERKFVMTPTEPISNSTLSAFVRSFISGRLKPTLLGQARPHRDRNPHCPSLVEVVTESFDEIVLDPSVDVLLESYTKRCDACKAFAPRMRMFAQLCEKHLPGLRIAEIDILENDRDVSHLPEKWTPAMRLFLKDDEGEEKGEGEKRVTLGKKESLRKASTATTIKNNKDEKKKKKSALLDYGSPRVIVSEGGRDEEKGKEVKEKEREGEKEDTTSNIKRRRSLISVSSQNNTPAPAPTRVVLPTLPDLIDFVEEATNGRLIAPISLRAAAVEAEEEAEQLEHVYDAVLNFMQLYKAYSTLLNDESEGGAASSGGAGEEEEGKRGSEKLRPVPEDKKKAAETLRDLVAQSHRYMVQEAALGGLSKALDQLDAVAEHVAKTGISDQIKAYNSSSMKYNTETSQLQ